MPDYIYLLENRLSPDQRSALGKLREAAHEAGMILFLTGDAVRDLTSGHAVRELEVAVHGNALKLKKSLEKSGAKVWGEDEPSRTLYLCFPGTVLVDVVSTHQVEYPKPGKPVYHPSSIHEDLRRRDFTANAMAISLNEGSFGLLMDPLNGAADIESRSLRLVSNYGFIEDPSLLIRATRYKVRLGWELEPRTQTRYENAKNDGVIEYLTPHSRSRELEQIAHEEDGLKVLQALEAENWMQALFSAWTASKADEAKLKDLHDLAVELLVQGVRADVSAAQMRLLTSGLSSKDLAALKKLMLRPGFVTEWESLDEIASGFSKVLLSKPYNTPSEAFKLFTSYDPEAILWLGFTSKAAGVKEKYDQFLKVWPEARQRIPHVLMQELRITPELPTYNDIVHQIFLQLIDGKLTTPEEMRAFLEPHSPPAPPPQVTIKRPRAKRGAEAKIKVIDDEEEDEDGLSGGDDMDDDMGGSDDDDFSLGKGDLDTAVPADEEESEHEEEEEDTEADDEAELAPAKKSSSKKAAPVPEKSVKPKGPDTSVVKPAAKQPAEAPAKPAHAPQKPAAHAAKPTSAAKAKPTPPPARKAVPVAKAVKPAKPSPAKHAPKPQAKPALKSKPVAKPARKETKPSTDVRKKAVIKHAKKR